MKRRVTVGQADRVNIPALVRTIGLESLLQVRRRLRLTRYGGKQGKETYPENEEGKKRPSLHQHNRTPGICHSDLLAMRVSSRLQTVVNKHIKPLITAPHVYGGEKTKLSSDIPSRVKALNTNAKC